MGLQNPLTSVTHYGGQPFQILSMVLKKPATSTREVESFPISAKSVNIAQSANANAPDGAAVKYRRKRMSFDLVLADLKEFGHGQAQAVNQQDPFD